MSARGEIRSLTLIAGIFLVVYFAPVGSPRLGGALVEALSFARTYAREHMLFGLLPAFFIAGAIAALVSKGAIMKYLGARAKRSIAYGVASISGSVLAVCSCTILPLFAGIYARGAGLGPATTFLYAGPAINVLAIILTARVLGAQIGIARAAGAVGFSIVVGLVMHVLFRGEEVARAEASVAEPEPDAHRPVSQSLLLFATMIAILALVNWGQSPGASGLGRFIYRAKWILAGVAGIALAVQVKLWFRLSAVLIGAAVAPAVVLALALPGRPLPAFLLGIAGLVFVTWRGGSESRTWLDESWSFAKRILPLLFAGILIVGFLLGRPGHEGLVPTEWITRLVGGNSLRSTIVAALSGGLMYFCTLTEVPIVQGLMGSGMGKGPALAFLLAGPAVSLPNVLIMRSVVGTRKTVVYLALVVTMATVAGFAFGAVFG